MDIRAKQGNCFSLYKPVFFILGLVLGHSMVEHGVTNIMASYLNDNWETPSFRTAAVTISVQEGLAAVLMIVVAHMADAVFGRFNMVVFTSFIYTIGLALLWILNPANISGLYLPVALLLALGNAGKEPPLKAFLADQLSDNINTYESLDEKKKKKKRLVSRTERWWLLSRFVGTLIATFVVAPQSWDLTFRISAIVMACALLLFMMGFSNYCRKTPTISPLTVVILVIKAAFNKRRLSYSDQPEDYRDNIDRDQLPLMPDIPFTRWLDRAALNEETSATSVEGQENKWEICTVKQVKEVKFLIEMFPMWATFGMYCLVKATGSTFFFEQSSDLDHRMGNFDAPTIFLYLIQSFSSLVISFLSGKIISKWFNDGEKKLVAMKVRIGIGMACSFMCCVVARAVEIMRMQKVKNKEFVDNESEIIAMSVFWLAPQFCLLGLSEGLTEEGLVQFFYYQVSESMESYGLPFNEFVLGIGKFISALWVLTFSNWIGDTLDDSQLDNYYAMLAVCSLGNLVFIYAGVSVYFYKDVRKLDIGVADRLEQIHQVQQNITTN